MRENAASSSPIQTDALASDRPPNSITSSGTTGTTIPKPSASMATVARTSPTEVERTGVVPVTGGRLSGMASYLERGAALYHRTAPAA